MESDRPASSSSARPRPWLLALLGIVVVAALVMRLGGSATPGVPASNPARRVQQQRGPAKLDPAQLDVRLEALRGERPGPGDSDRNPFGFKPKPPPPPAPVDTFKPPPVTTLNGPGKDDAPRVAPITVKFIGIITAPDGRQIASFTDCRLTYQVYEGNEFAGQYRLVKIGVESVVVERVDGTGRTTLPMSGQECVGR
jgi:hypothetical protein